MCKHGIVIHLLKSYCSVGHTYLFYKLRTTKAQNIVILLGIAKIGKFIRDFASPVAVGSLLTSQSQWIFMAPPVGYNSVHSSTPAFVGITVAVLCSGGFW